MICTISVATDLRLNGIVVPMILNFFIRSMALSTCILTRAIRFVNISSCGVRRSLPDRDWGMLRSIFRGSSISLIKNPPSAISLLDLTSQQDLT